MDSLSAKGLVDSYLKITDRSDAGVGGIDVSLDLVRREHPGADCVEYVSWEVQRSCEALRTAVLPLILSTNEDFPEEVVNAMRVLVQAVETISLISPEAEFPEDIVRILNRVNRSLENTLAELGHFVETGPGGYFDLSSEVA